MRLTTEIKLELVKRLELVMNGKVKHDYTSGPGMFGKNCLAFSYNSVEEAREDKSRVLTYGENLDDENEEAAFLILYMNSQIVQTSEGAILYFGVLNYPLVASGY